MKARLSAGSPNPNPCRSRTLRGRRGPFHLSVLYDAPVPQDHARVSRADGWNSRLEREIESDVENKMARERDRKSERYRTI